MTNSTDQVLIDRLLSQRHWVRALAVRLVGDPEAADDVAQEALFRVLRRPPRHGLHLRAWLERVVRSVVRESERSDRSRRAREASVPSVGVEEDAAQIAQRVELQQTLTQAVLDLPMPQREVILLRFLGGCSVEKTARRLGTSPGTVGSRQHRALATLRERLDKRHGCLIWPVALRRWLTREPTGDVATAVTASAAGVTLMSSMAAKLGGSVVACVLVGGGLWTWQSRHTDPEPFRDARALPLAAIDGPRHQALRGGGLESTPVRLVEEPAAEQTSRSEDRDVGSLQLLLEIEGERRKTSVLVFDEQRLLGPSDVPANGRVLFSSQKVAARGVGQAREYSEPRPRVGAVGPGVARAGTGIVVPGNAGH